MKKENLIKLIINDIEDIKKIAEGLDPQNVEEIYVELAISKTNNLLKELHLLSNNKTDKIVEKIITPKIEVKKEIKTAPEITKIEEKIEPVIDQKQETIIKPKDKIEEKIEAITETKEKIEDKEEVYELDLNEIVKEVIEEKKVEKTEKEEIKEQPIVVNKITENKIEETSTHDNNDATQQTLIESLVKEDNSINKKFANNNKISGSINNTKNCNIKSLIGFNDRFMFVRELFNGDDQKYNEELTRIENNNEQDIISKLLNEFSWDKEDQPTKLFISYIQKCTV